MKAYALKKGKRYVRHCGNSWTTNINRAMLFDTMYDALNEYLPGEQVIKVDVTIKKV